jgi:hypothetical protein
MVFGDRSIPPGTAPPNPCNNPFTNLPGELKG